MTNSSTKKDNFLLPSIADLKSAQKAARQGSTACALIITLSSVVAAISTSTDGIPPSQWFIATMIVYGVIAILIYRMSRFAAIAGLTLYLGDRAVLLANQGLSINLIITILFVFAFINAIRGTFAYHQLRQQRRKELQGSDTTSTVE